MIQRIAYLPLIIVIAGCRQDVPPATSANTTPAKATCRIERSLESEAVLAQLSQKTWVFRHSGTPLNPVFKAIYKPAGKDATEKTFFQADGRTTLNALSSGDPAKRANEKKGGFIIVTFPGDNSDAQLSFSFTLNGAHSRFTVPKDSLPSLYSAPPDPSGPIHFEVGTGPIEKPITLSPGESRDLASISVQRNFDPNVPVDERETIRYILSVTALNEGELPQQQDGE